MTTYDMSGASVTRWAWAAGMDPSAMTIEQGRPTKKDRRELPDWQRWSASTDE